MNIKILNQSILDFTGDLLIVNLFEGVKAPGGATGTVDKALDGMISKSINDGEITGKLGETIVFHTFDKLPVGKVMVVGLGKSENFGPEAIRRASGSAATQAKKIKTRGIGTIVHGAGIGGIEPESAVCAVVEGTLLALYEFDKYKKDKDKRIEEFTILEIDKEKTKKFKKGTELAEILAQSQNIARDLTNEPANNLTPESLSEQIKKIINDLGLDKKIKIEVLNKKGIGDLKMGALLSVGQGSTNEPKFIILRLENPDAPLICLVGKTITFDSGGISLKQAEGLNWMKGDMAGGSAVFGTILALAKADIKLNVMAIIPAVENMPSGSASRPGDVVQAMNGKTIEIISTDAEGRMTLADAICYAEKEDARVIVDIATLTGGSVITFGDITAAVMGNDQKLIDTLLDISKNTGERLWQLPLFEEYEEKMKSDIADIKNSGGRNASPITAGIFLKSFVNKALWLHIDIAGKELSEKEGYYQPKGGTGFGVRTLFKFCQKLPNIL